jgi:lipoprotein-anchoring transpeptidase ErfK/SrfK
MRPLFSILTITALSVAMAPANGRDVANVLALQVALDRAGFSTGLIDGRLGPRTRDIVALLQRERGLTAADGGTPTAATLGLAPQRGTRAYEVTAEDAAGPFVDIPSDLMAQGELPALEYSSAAERLAERFHTDPATLRRLNPRARLAAGESIQVPDVEPLVPPPSTGRRDGPGPRAAEVRTIVVSRTPPLAVVIGHSGAVLFAAPVTSGSERDPLPIGQWKTLDVYLRPVFRYNPDLFWDADPGHARTIIKPGPNNPVGLAWIDIDREHYGLHGTPEPQTVGHAASHGCVRLTNWDIVRLIDFVRVGTPIIFDEHLPPMARTGQ